MNLHDQVLSPSESTPGKADNTQKFWRRLFRRPVAVVCIGYLVIVVGIAIFGSTLFPGVAEQQAGDLLATGDGPSLEHLLGTDSLGRDVLARIVAGTQITVIGVGEALAVALLLGLPFGLAAGYRSGWVDRSVGWFADLAFSMPTIVVILVVLSVFPQSMTAAMVTFGVLAAPSMIRVVRSATLPVRQELYIDAARAAGLPGVYIVSRHVLPRIAGAVIVQASLLSGVALLVQTGLGFLNVVVVPPAPSWGGMIADGWSVIHASPWLIFPPGVAVVLTVLALGLLGDTVRDTTAENWSSPVRRNGREGRKRWRTEASTGEPRGIAAPGDALLSVEDLTVVLDSPAGPTTVVDEVSFDLVAGETVAIVGESGCGKTMTARSILGLLPATARIDSGRILFDERDLAAMPERALRQIRGKRIGLISQEPMVSLNPAIRIGRQLAEVVRTHHGTSRRVARSRAIELLQRVELAEPELIARRYPHELSGGMAQRVAIARALAGDPDLLIADEPTTALDVTLQAEILNLLRQLQHERNMAILLVTHDWGVVADLADRALVMYAGQVVERGPLVPIFREPLHPYTQGLLASNPHHAPEAETLPSIPGTVPQPVDWPTGCHFHPRCRYATVTCTEHRILLEEPTEGRQTRCIHYDRLRA